MFYYAFAHTELINPTIGVITYRKNNGLWKINYDVGILQRCLTILVLTDSKKIEGDSCHCPEMIKAEGILPWAKAPC